MNGTAARFLRLGVGLSGLLVLGWVLDCGQAAKPVQRGLANGLAHRHVIFSRPATFEQVRQVGERSTLLAAMVSAARDACSLRPSPDRRQRIH